jgi:aryl carrier-like protein
LQDATRPDPIQRGGDLIQAGLDAARRLVNRIVARGR